MTDSHPPKPKRRWYQFRLRTLLVVTLVLGVASGWIGTRVQRARKNRQAMAEIRRTLEEAGGPAYLRYVKRPDWLGNLLGDPGVLRVVTVYVTSPSGFDDAALKRVRGLTSLEDLHLQDTKVTDAGLAHLEGLTNLRYLFLRDTKVTDAGLVHLEGLSSLDRLWLQGTKVTREGVTNLGQSLPKCHIYH